MTYWPISSPSVFAATKTTDLARTPVSHDGTNRPSQDVQDDASETDSTADTDDSTSTGEIDRVKEGTAEKEGDIQGSEQLAEDDVHGEIIAIRVTRSGQLFATLTQTTLTIWQTKVCSLHPSNQTLLTSFSPPSY